MSDKGHQAMWPKMIAALAAIDAELGLPEDGCNSTAQTLAAIRALTKDAARYRKLRAGSYSRAVAVSILNDTPHGIDAAVDALP